MNSGQRLSKRVDALETDNGDQWRGIKINRWISFSALVIAIIDLILTVAKLK